MVWAMTWSNWIPYDKTKSPFSENEERQVIEVELHDGQAYVAAYTTHMGGGCDHCLEWDWTQVARYRTVVV